MDFFVSWTRRDPIFQEYDPNACVLVSPHYVTRNWSVYDWKKLPKQLLIDSGAYSLSKNVLSCEDILNRQLSMARGWNNSKNLFFCHPDLIIPKGCTHLEMNHLVMKSLRRAKKYIDLIKKKKLTCTPIGVIHGFDYETLISSYYELKDVGFKHFAVGSLAVRFSHSKRTCMDVIKTLSQFQITPLHLFGVLWPSHLPNQTCTITSFDSSAPSKLGFYGTVLYGYDLKRYVISPNSKQRFRDNFFKFRESIEKPLPCDCPICSDDPKKLTHGKETTAKFYRTIHNYFQIKWATEKLN